MASPPAREGDGSSTPEKKKKEKDKKDKKKPGELEADGELGKLRVKGRLFARAAYSMEERTVIGRDGLPDDVDVHSVDLLIRSARLGVKYRAPAKWLRAEVEAEFRQRAQLRDGYVHAKGEEFSAQAGQFKMPMSRIELDSAFTVPVVERGLIRQLLLDWMEVAGRRPGLTVGWRGESKPRPSLVLGAFQGSRLVRVTPGQRDTEYAWGAGEFAQSLVGGAGLDFGKVEVDAFYEHRLGSPALGENRHYPTAGADVVADLPVLSGGLRIWLNAIAGASWYEHSGKPEDDSDAVFALGRMIMGYRLGGAEPEAFYVEPFLMLGLLDPDLDVVDDKIHEAIAGVNVGLWERARIGLQGEWTGTSRNVPEGLALATVRTHVAVMTQASVVF